MTGDSGYGTRSITYYAGLLWVWTALVSLGSAVWFWMSTSAVDYESGENTHSDIFFLIGLVLGAVSTLPFWAVFGLGAHLARKLDGVEGAARFQGKRASAGESTV